MFSTSYFKTSLSTISINFLMILINDFNAMPAGISSKGHFEVVLKIMTVAELFIVMTTSPG